MPHQRVLGALCRSVFLERAAARRGSRGREVTLVCLSCLQWTPKDDWAALKLHGKCDDVMQLLMDELGLEIPVYDR